MRKKCGADGCDIVVEYYRKWCDAHVVSARTKRQDLAIKMMDDGLSFRKIGEQLGISASRASKIIDKRLRELGQVRCRSTD